MPAEVLTDLERRVIANLSIPRNALDLTTAIRADGAAPGGLKFDAEHDGLVKSLIEHGWIASLGNSHESPADLVGKVESHAHALTLPDEKAKLYIARREVRSRRWRAAGEQFIMTQDGFAKLHEPVDPKPALELWEVQDLVDAQSRRVHHGEVTEGTLLGSDGAGDCVMLEDEFAAWFKSLKREYPELRAPIAGGAGYADATELLILDPENGKGSAYTETAPWFMAAVTVAITDADTGSTITEAAYTGYARKSTAAADMNTAAAGSASNANAIAFAACTAGTAAVIGFGKCVALTVGRLIKYGTCTTVNVSSTQTPLQFAAGAFTTTLD